MQEAGRGQPGHTQAAQGCDGVCGRRVVQIPMRVVSLQVPHRTVHSMRSQRHQNAFNAQYISVHSLVFVFNALYIAHSLFSS